MAPDMSVLQGYDRANFEGAYTQKMLDSGIKDAQEVLKLPAGARFKQLQESLKKAY